MTQEKFLIILKDICNREIYIKEENPDFLQYKETYRKHQNLMRLAADSSVPPEYRRAGLRQNQITITPAGDVYSLMTYMFSLITNKKLPVNFQLGKRWKPLLEEACLDWDETGKQAFFQLFYHATKISEKDRIQSILALTETPEYQELINEPGN